MKCIPFASVNSVMRFSKRFQILRGEGGGGGQRKHANRD